MSQPVYTIGHSTRPIDEFIGLLQAQAITQLVDIRTVPRTRHNPQYEQDALATALTEAGIAYVYLKALGGLRPKVSESSNAGWRNQSFRNYADYMQTEQFRHGLAELLHVSESAPTAIMCAEAVPWRCHRSLVADALIARGVRVFDIINAGEPTLRRLTPFAVVGGVDVTYPGPAD
ncbi:MAG: DUF488 family protein [Aeromicrobium sp.]